MFSKEAVAVFLENIRNKALYTHGTGDEAVAAAQAVVDAAGLRPAQRHWDKDKGAAYYSAMPARTLGEAIVFSAERLAAVYGTTAENCMVASAVFYWIDDGFAPEIGAILFDEGTMIGDDDITVPEGARHVPAWVFECCFGVGVSHGF